MDKEKQKLVELLKECEAIKFGRFVLTSGAVSDYYIDIKKASTKAKILEKIAEMMAEKTENNLDLIAGMELGAVPLATALSLKTKTPYVIVRKEEKKHGTSKQIEGENVKNKEVIVVEDVTTSGGSLKKTIRILREKGAKVNKAITVVDRESGAKEKIQNLDVEFITLLTVNDILEK